MRLTDILKPQNIKIPLEAANKTQAITELVNVLAQSGDVSDAKKVLESVLERESTRTTGIGNGLAIPHGKTTGTADLVMAIGRPAAPIGWLRRRGYRRGGRSDALGIHRRDGDVLRNRDLPGRVRLPRRGLPRAVGATLLRGAQRDCPDEQAEEQREPEQHGADEHYDLRGPPLPGRPS